MTKTITVVGLHAAEYVFQFVFQNLFRSWSGRKRPLKVLYGRMINSGRYVSILVLMAVPMKNYGIEM